jgi:adenosylhomocysteine nucleosidase
MSKIAIVAALEREVRPLVKRWHMHEKQHGGRHFRFFEKDDVVLVCGGIGAEGARRAAEAVIAMYTPDVIYSAGFAGALDPELKIADIVQPRRVVNAGDGSSVNLDHGERVLVSFASVANPAQKAKLRENYEAHAVDMEAAAVARAAEARGVGFAVVKVISDEVDFTFPSLQRFVDSEGKFSEVRFAWFAALRPWLWPQVARLARDSGRASRALCNWIQSLNATQMADEAHTLQAVEKR